MYYQSQTLIFHNGKFTQAHQAGAHLYSQSLHYGIGVLDGLRAYKTNEGPQIFKAFEHYDRFLRSAQKIGIQIPYTLEELVQLTYRLLDRNHLDSAYIRPLAYVGANMELETSSETHLMIAAWPWENFRGKEPLDVKISSYQRLHPKSVPMEAKITGYYVNSVLAMNEAKQAGFGATLLLDGQGFVAEGAASNFFYEKEGCLFTPPAGNILPGITRATVFDIAAELGIKVIEKLFGPEAVYQADTAFFTGTASEIAAIKSIDGHPFPKKWKDTMAAEIQRKYHQRVLLRDYDHYSII
ncbi:MAG: branched-chain amino acid transaminase [Microscillaceae bacterium]|nr:branched-chain amino acid transaminase [Microscillaceae bacterium]